MAVGTLDQSDNSAGAEVAIGSSNANFHYSCQQVKIGVAGNVSDVELRLSKIVGSPTDNVEVAIYSDNGSDRPNILISDVQTIAGSSLTASLATYLFTFSTRPAVAVNDLIWIVVTRSGANDGSNYYAIQKSASSTYANGIHVISPDLSTYIVRDKDAWFNEYYVSGGWSGGVVNSTAAASISTMNTTAPANITSISSVT